MRETMRETELVSIIIPCYNGARALQRCLTSVFAQTYPNFEVLLINDGSTDGTRAIADGLARADARVRVFHRKNHGVSATRNFGMRHARGTFVQFLDADDEIAPTMLERLLTALRVTGADCAACNYFGNPMFLSSFTDRVFDLTDPRELLEYTQDTFGFLVVWNKLFRRETLRDVRFDEEIHFSEDELFNLAVLRNLRKMVTLSDRLYHYHCAAEENGVSCLQKIVSDAGFGVQKTSIWYQGEQLIPRRRSIVEEAVREGRLVLPDPDDLVYARVLDFFFWEISAYAFFGIGRELLGTETANVFAEPAFQYSYQMQEKYGLTFRRMSAEEWQRCAVEFTAICADCYADVRKNLPELNHGRMFYLIFLKMFAVDTGAPLDPSGSLARRMAELRENLTPEARYVNALAWEQGCAS